MTLGRRLRRVGAAAVGPHQDLRSGEAHPELARHEPETDRLRDHEARDVAREVFEAATLVRQVALGVDVRHDVDVGSHVILRIIRLPKANRS